MDLGSGDRSIGNHTVTGRRPGVCGGDLSLRTGTSEEHTVRPGHSVGKLRGTVFRSCAAWSRLGTSLARGFCRYRRIDEHPVAILSLFEDAFMLLAMRLVLSPAACLLPKIPGNGTSGRNGPFPCPIPEIGYSVYWQMRKAFGKGRLESFNLSWRSFALPFRDYVVFRRLSHDRETVRNWNIVERNSEAVKALRESGEPYILAVGHFVREAVLAIYEPMVTPGRAVLLTSAIPDGHWSLRKLLFRTQLGSALKALPPRTDLEFVFVGTVRRPLRGLSGCLSRRGGFVSIAVDAPWRGKEGGRW